MKKILLLSLLAFSSVALKAQTLNCNNFCVLGMTLDAVAHRLNVTIANNDTNFVNYPTVVVTNAAGDTVGNIENTFYLFGQPANDTTVHNISTTLTTLPSSFTGFVYLTDQVWDLTCMFGFPMSCSVGITENNPTANISIYPNPATDKITLELNNSNNKTMAINIFDVAGKTVKAYNTNAEKLVIDRDGLESGLYFVSIAVEGKRVTRKLVIK